MKLLLITGAGASRNLGVDGSMPLMPDWSDALCDALDDNEAGLASACHLTRGMTGEQFEQNLGSLLRWQQVRYLEERFQDLGGRRAGAHLEQIEEARRNIDTRMTAVMKAINVTLYEQFGQGRIDDERSRAAFEELLERLQRPEIAVATTNYDRSCETALTMLGYPVDTGFRQRPHRTPVLEPAGLTFGDQVPLIHLHGAVGWYERDGHVGDHHADQPFNPSLGMPVVLYPDPEKDPTSDAIVSKLWTEFNALLDEADSVLVIGHSLHDPALERALRRVASSKPVVITCLSDDGPEMVESKIAGAIGTTMEFGPKIRADEKLRMMVENGSRPAFIRMSS